MSGPKTFKFSPRHTQSWINGPSGWRLNEPLPHTSNAVAVKMASRSHALSAELFKKFHFSLKNIAVLCFQIASVCSDLIGFRFGTTTKIANENNRNREHPHYQKCNLIFAHILILLIMAPPVNGATLYCSPSGGGSGADFNNLATFPNTTGFTRGDTYVLIDGVYGNKTFSEPLSGSTLVTVRKAHSIDSAVAGYSAAFHDEQSIFNSTIRFATGFWVFDGMVRDDSDIPWTWANSNSYGFYIVHNNEFGNVVIEGHSIVVARTAVSALLGNFSGVDERRYGFDCDSFGGAIWTGLRFSSNMVWGSNNTWFLRTTDGAIVEYSYNYGAGGNGANHGENVNLYFTADNAIIRYNWFHKSFITGIGGSGGTAIMAIQGGGNGGKIHGNLIDEFQVGDCAVGFGPGSGDGSNYECFQNTIIKSSAGAGGFGFETGSANLVQNNLFVGVNDPNINDGTGGTTSHNSYSNASGDGTSTQLNVPTSIFVNYAGGDYDLAANTSAGVTLSAPYNVDMRGNPYNISGTWSRGAFAFVEEGEAEGSGSVATAIPGAGNKMRRRIPR